MTTIPGGRRPATFQPVRPVRLYQRIVTQVEDALARGDLKPGQRLPSERELVLQFGTSRSTVREALRVLESNGIVRSRPGDPNGPEVLPVSAGGLTKQLDRLTRVDGLGLAELIGSRMILDSSANRLAARLRTEDELAEMDAAIATMRAVIDQGYERFSQADIAFHDAVARASRNALIQLCNQAVRNAVLSLISTEIRQAHHQHARMRASARHHEEVLAAIRAGDGPAAARISRHNLFDYYSGYLAPAEREPLRALLED